VRTLVIGDFNAFEFTDGYVDAVGQIKGDFDPAVSLLSGPDLVAPELVNLVDTAIAAEERYSFIFGGSAQVLDHGLVSAGLLPLVRGAGFGRGNADAAVDLVDDDGVDNLPLRSSDHDGLVVYLETGCPRDLKQVALEKIAAILSTGDRRLDRDLEEARRWIIESLDSRFWLDGRHLDARHGKKVFDREKMAVKGLAKALDRGPAPELATVLSETIVILLRADDELASSRQAAAIGPGLGLPSRGRGLGLRLPAPAVEGSIPSNPAIR
jgi:hypothetical protein